MSYETHRRIGEFLEVETYEDDDPEKVAQVGEGTDSFRWIRKWLHCCCKAWRRAWEAGMYITVDETMLTWTGLGEGHLTFLPRKPHPNGFQMKVTRDSESGVMLHAEFVEGAEVDMRKQFVKEFKDTTACTLRITRPWWGTGRVVIGDAWFGSIRTVEELRDKGLYCILSVKNGSAGFPKAELKERLQRRGDTAFFVAEIVFDNGSVKPVYAGGHMDKKPLMLAATTGTVLVLHR